MKARCSHCCLTPQLVRCISAILVLGWFASAGVAQDSGEGSGALRPPPPHRINGFQFDSAGTVDGVPPPALAPHRGGGGNGHSPGLWDPGNNGGTWFDPAGAWTERITLPLDQTLDDLHWIGAGSQAGGFAATPLGDGAAGIPEPTTLLMLFAGAALAFRRRR